MTRNKMKVAILTFADTTNFGASLQAWALRKAVTELGHSANVINYRPPEARRFYWNTTYRNNLRNWKGLLTFAKFRSFGYRQLGFNTLSLATHSELFQALKRYDAVIVGSDEVWKNNSLRPFDPSFYLKGPGDFKRIAFAASAGSLTDWSMNRGEISTALAGFDAISVRDDHTAAMVEACIGHSPQVVADPTLLLGSPLPPQGARNAGRGKIVLYGDFSAKEQIQLKRYSETTGKPMISLGHCNWESGAEVHLGIGPFGWLDRITSADLVVTHYFHGAIFGLKSGRPTIVRMDSRRRHKLESLKNYFDASHSFMDSLDAIPADHTPSAPIGGEMLENSRSFLRCALE
jgi:polysaccharide pyruvyl transferase WcaK-like protein